MYESCELAVCALQRLGNPELRCTTGIASPTAPATHSAYSLDRAFQVLPESSQASRRTSATAATADVSDTVLSALLAGAGLAPDGSRLVTHDSQFDDRLAYRVADSDHIASDVTRSRGPRDLQPGRARVWDPGRKGEVRRGLFAYHVEEQSPSTWIALRGGHRSSLPKTVALEPFALSKGCHDGQSPCRAYSVAPFLSAECQRAGRTGFQCAENRLREWVESPEGQRALTRDMPASHDHPSWWRVVHTPVAKPRVADPGWPGKIRSGRFAEHLESQSLRDRLAIRDGSLALPEGMAEEPSAAAWGCYLSYSECAIYSVAPYRCESPALSHTQCAEERLERWAASDVGQRTLMGHPPPPNHPSWRPAPEFFVFGAPPRPSHDASPKRPADLAVTKAVAAASSETGLPLRNGQFESPLPPRLSDTVVASLPVRPRQPSPPAPRDAYAFGQGAVRRDAFARFVEDLPFPHLINGLRRGDFPLPEELRDEAWRATDGCFSGESQCRVYSVASFDCGLKKLTEFDCAEKRIDDWSRSPEGRALLQQRVALRTDGRVRRSKLARYVEELTVQQRRAFVRRVAALGTEGSIPVGMEPVALGSGCFTVGAECRAYSVRPHRTLDCRARHIGAFQCARERLDNWEGSQWGQLALAGEPMPAGHDSWWPPGVADPGNPGEVRRGLFADFMEQQPFSTQRPTRRIAQTELPPHLAMEPVAYDRGCYSIHEECRAYSVAPYMSVPCLLLGLGPYQCAEKRLDDWVKTRHGQTALAGEPLPPDHPSWQIASEPRAVGLGASQLLE